MKRRKNNPILRNLFVTLVTIVALTILGFVAKFGGKLVEKVLSVGTKELAIIVVAVIVWSIVLGVCEKVYKHKAEPEKPEDKRKTKIKEEDE